MKNTTLPFSKRYRKAISEGRIMVVLTKQARGRLWQTLETFDDAFYHNPYVDNPTFNETTTPSRETYNDLLKIYGTPVLVVDRPGVPQNTFQSVCREYAMTCRSEELFDLVQVWIDYLEMPDRQHVLQQELNAVFDQENTGWILVNRHFHKLDSRFMEESVLTPVTELLIESDYTRTRDVRNCIHPVTELLIESDYTGPLEEFQKARDFLEDGDHKQAIDHAYMAYESALKAVTGMPKGQFNELVGKIPIGFFGGLPEGIDKMFRKNVFDSLPPMRHNLGGHGQGAHSFDVPREFAELAVHLAGSLIIFLIKRQAAITPMPDVDENPLPSVDIDDEVPF